MIASLRSRRDGGKETNERGRGEKEYEVARDTCDEERPLDKQYITHRSGHLRGDGSSPMFSSIRSSGRATRRNNPWIVLHNAEQTVRKAAHSFVFNRAQQRR